MRGQGLNDLGVNPLIKRIDHRLLNDVEDGRDRRVARSSGAVACSSGSLARLLLFLKHNMISN
jgi:hypothetical protein